MAHKTNIRILALILAIIAMLFCFVSCGEKGNGNDETQAPQRGEFVPPPFEKAVVKGAPEIADPNAVGYAELDARAYKVAICGKVKLNEGKADVYFTNPESNDVWLKLRVLNEAGEIIAETGIVMPGEYLKTITFTKAVSVGDKITIKIMGYEPHTYYSKGEANLNTFIY